MFIKLLTDDTNNETNKLLAHRHSDSNSDSVQESHQTQTGKKKEIQSKGAEFVLLWTLYLPD